MPCSSWLLDEIGSKVEPQRPWSRERYLKTCKIRAYAESFDTALHGGWLGLDSVVNKNIVLK